MEDNSPPDPYEDLGVTKDADLHTIRKAHRKLVLKNHPDKFSDPVQKAAQQDVFQRIQQAYELLSDEEKRNAYDERVKLLKMRKEMGVSSSKPTRNSSYEHGRHGIPPTVGAGSSNSASERNIPPKKTLPERKAAKSNPDFIQDPVPKKLRSRRQRKDIAPRLNTPTHVANEVVPNWTLPEREAAKPNADFNYDSVPRRPQLPPQREIIPPRPTPIRVASRSVPDVNAREVVPKRSPLEYRPFAPSRLATESVPEVAPKMTLLEHISYAPQLVPESVPYVNARAVGSSTYYNRRERPKGILVTHGQLNGFDTHAIPDTGAEFNIIALSYAQKIGLQVRDTQPSQCRLLRMANGKHIKTVGIVTAAWCFMTDALQSWEIILHVLSDFVYDVILGSQFLFTTQTMSHHQKRMSRIPRPVQSLSILRVNILGSATRYVNGYLQRDRVRALPDSGSEPSLLSYDYARMRGFTLSMDMDDQNLLQFADGSVTKTEGSIIGRWVFGPAIIAKTYRVKFHILRGCSHNIILGQDILDTSDAFLHYENSFLEIESTSETSGLNLVIWLPKKKKKTGVSHGVVSAVPPAPSPDDALHVELQRRASADRRIARMKPGIVRDAAMEDEKQLRLDYDSRTGNDIEPRRTSTTDSENSLSTAGNYSSNSTRSSSARSSLHSTSRVDPTREEAFRGFQEPVRAHVYGSSGVDRRINAAEIQGEYDFNRRAFTAGMNFSTNRV